MYVYSCLNARVTSMFNVPVSFLACAFGVLRVRVGLIFERFRATNAIASFSSYGYDVYR